MSWKEIKVSGVCPPGVDGSCGTVIGDNMYIYGGKKGFESITDIYKLDLTTSIWCRIDSGSIDHVPGERWGATLTAIGTVLYLVGGSNRTNVVMSVHAFDTVAMQWRNVNTTAKMAYPGARRDHSMVVHPHRSNVLVMYGGMGENKEYSDVCMLDTSTNEWEIVDIDADLAPPTRSRHAAAVHKGTMYVFAGLNTDTGAYRRQCWNDLFAFTFDTEGAGGSWREVTTSNDVPAARSGHGMFVIGDRLFVWGGDGSMSDAYNELHYLDLEDNSWCKARGRKVPDARHGHFIVALPDGVRAVVAVGTINGKKDNHSTEVWTVDVSAIY